MTYAALPVRTIAILVILRLLGAWLAFLLKLGAGGRPEKLPANLKPYLTDDELESRKVVNVGVLGLVTAMVLAVVMAGYWLFIPRQQANAADKFLHESIEYGEALFQATDHHKRVRETLVQGLGCATCHGGGLGGKVDDYILLSGPDRGKKVSWECPPLNDVFYRYTREEVKEIIVHGRPNTPMPAWGLARGGPLPDQLVEDLLNYLKSIEVPREEAQRTAGYEGDRKLSDGRQLFLKNCARCHTPGYSISEIDDRPVTPEQRGALPQGQGAFGPPLTNEAAQFPEVDDQVDFIKSSEAGKAYGVRGVATGRMPDFGADQEQPLLDDEQIRAIAEYERTIREAGTGSVPGAPVPATGAGPVSPGGAGERGQPTTVPSPTPSPAR